jgi:hypothetical protein
MSKFTREQAAIICAYTGVCAGPFQDLQEYAEKKLGRPVWTHEFADPELKAELKAASRDDFVALCAVRGEL